MECVNKDEVIGLGAFLRSVMLNRKASAKYYAVIKDGRLRFYRMRETDVVVDYQDLIPIQRFYSNVIAQADQAREAFDRIEKRVA